MALAARLVYASINDTQCSVYVATIIVSTKVYLSYGTRTRIAYAKASYPLDQRPCLSRSQVVHLCRNNALVIQPKNKLSTTMLYYLRSSLKPLVRQIHGHVLVEGCSYA